MELQNYCAICGNQILAGDACSHCLDKECYCHDCVQFGLSKHPEGVKNETKNV